MPCSLKQTGRVIFSAIAGVNEQHNLAPLQAYSLNFLLVLSLTLLVGPPLVEGQTILYDWQGGAGGVLLSWPTNLIRTEPVPFVIRNINNLMYSYGISGSCSQNAVEPWRIVAPVISPVISNVTNPQRAPSPDPCETAADQAKSDWNSFETSFTTFRGLPASTSTGSSCSVTAPCRLTLEAAETTLWQPVDSALQKAKNSITNAINQCSANPEAVVQMQTLASKLSDVENWYNAPHTWQGTASISPDSNCTFTINETYLGAATSPARTVTFIAGQPRMTVTVGPLFSELEDRSYSVVTTPPASGSTTNQTVLQVNGVSKFSPYLAGLLNFAVPVPNDWLNGESGGFAISTGPVIRIGSQTSSSPFGWFAGGSYHLYHLLYVSAGVHIGEFSDFPAGFTANGQPVPPGFPTPVGINRTSARFAFSVSFKASDLSALGKTGGSAKQSSP